MPKHYLAKANLNIDDQLKELKTKKANIGKLFDIEISKLDLQKNAVKSEQDKISSKEKEDKIREKLIKDVMADKSGSYAGGDVDSLIPVTPEAQGQPIVSNKA